MERKSVNRHLKKGQRWVYLYVWEKQIRITGSGGVDKNASIFVYTVQALLT